MYKGIKKSGKQFKSVKQKKKLNIEDMNQMLEIYLLLFNFAKKIFSFRQEKEK